MIIREDTAMFCEAFPCNPRPFLRQLDKDIERHGTGFIETDEAKRILWVIIALAYGQLATVQLVTEYDRLRRAFLREHGPDSLLPMEVCNA